MRKKLSKDRNNITACINEKVFCTSFYGHQWQNHQWYHWLPRQFRVLWSPMAKSPMVPLAAETVQGSMVTNGNITNGTIGCQYSSGFYGHQWQHHQWYHWRNDKCSHCLVLKRAQSSLWWCCLSVVSCPIHST